MEEFLTKFVFAVLAHLAEKLKMTLSTVKKLFFDVIFNEYCSSGEIYDIIKPHLPAIIATRPCIKEVMALLGSKKYAVQVGDKVYISANYRSKQACSVQIEPGVTTIESWMIQPFRNSMREVCLPNTVTEIADDAFENTSVVSLVFPEGLDEIPRWVCSRCSDLKRVTLPEGLTKIGFGAFGYCNSLEDINIPDSVTTIDGDAFRGCDALSEEIRKRILDIGGQDAFDWKPKKISPEL